MFAYIICMIREIDSEYMYTHNIKNCKNLFDENIFTIVKRTNTMIIQYGTFSNNVSNKETL